MREGRRERERGRGKEGERGGGKEREGEGRRERRREGEGERGEDGRGEREQVSHILSYYKLQGVLVCTYTLHLCGFFPCNPTLCLQANHEYHYKCGCAGGVGGKLCSCIVYT